jgi:outer membrane receptor for ferric coprogen and ferric-rhodotorulic acid
VTQTADGRPRIRCTLGVPVKTTRARVAGRRRTRFCRSHWFVGIVALLLTTLSQFPCRIALAADPLDRPITLDIRDNTPLDEALIEWGVKAGVELMINTPTIAHQTTHGVHGTMPAGNALSIILRDSGLTYTAQGERIRVVPITTPVRTAQREEHPESVPTPSSISETQTTPANESDVQAGKTASDVRGEKLETVTVTGRYEFLSVDTSGATNLPLPIEKVPQSISLVSNDFIKAADLKNLGEIAEYTPGAINAGNQENFGSLIEIRGFAAGVSVDGINVLRGAYYEPDYAIFDRLEVVKGPSSVVYGVSSPGGLVNFVTKSPTPQTVDYLYAQAGSWNSYRIEGQVAGALDSQGHIRAIGVAVYDRGNSFIDELYHTKTSLYGGINFALSDSVSGYLHGGYERFVRPSVDGNLTEPDGSPAPVPLSFFWGSKNIVETTNVYHAEGDFTWHATNMLDFSIKGNYESANTLGALSYVQGLSPNGDIGLDVTKFDRFRSDNYGIGLSSIYRLEALGLKNSFISLATLYQETSSTGRSKVPPTAGTANIFSGGEASIAQGLDALLTGPLLPIGADTKNKTFTASMQSVLQVIDPLSLLAGLSYSKPDVTESLSGIATSYINGISQNFSIPGQTSYRAGLTYEFVARANAYVSYSQSFNPQPYFMVNHNPVPPLTGEQYEVGLKYRSSTGRLLLSGAVFDIKEKNLAQYDQTINGQDYYKPIGEVTHKGVELQAVGQITPVWQINAGYAYLDAKITGASASAADTLDQRQLYLPKQTLSLFTSYTLQGGVLRGLSLGVGARYVGSEQTAYNSALANLEVLGSSQKTKDLPGYSVVDATLGYAFNKWLVQFNAHNVFDKRYFINNYQTLFYGNTPGDTKNVALSVRRQF